MELQRGINMVITYLDENLHGLRCDLKMDFRTIIALG